MNKFKNFGYKIASNKYIDISLPDKVITSNISAIGNQAIVIHTRMDLDTPIIASYTGMRLN